MKKFFKELCEAVKEKFTIVKEVEIIKEIPLKHENKGLYFEVYKGKNKKWYFRLKASNHKILTSTNQGYENKKDCMHTGGLIKDGAFCSNIKVKRQNEK